jgi:hypothetical protein
MKFMAAPFGKPGRGPYATVAIGHFCDAHENRGRKLDTHGHLNFAPYDGANESGHHEAAGRER